MAGVDTYTISAGIRTILAADADVAATGAVIEIEPDFMRAQEYGLFVAIYPGSWSAPSGMQRIGAGRRMDIRLLMQVVVCSFALDLAVANRNRDDLAARVMRALIADRTLSGTVVASWPDGASYDTVGLESASFLSLVEIRIVADAIATV